VGLGSAAYVNSGRDSIATIALSFAHENALCPRGTDSADPYETSGPGERAVFQQVPGRPVLFPSFDVSQTEERPRRLGVGSGMDGVDRRLAHPAFPQPDRTNRAVWHYMTLAKFIALLDTGALFFCRLDCLNDDYEGSLPQRWRHERRSAPRETAQARKLRESCFVNCWNMSDDESEALWRLYGAQDASVAIRTTYDELLEVMRLHERLYLGLINYADYEKDKINTTSDGLARVMHKRRAFRHEEEVRFVRVRCEPDDQSQTGLDVPIDLDRLVQAIYIDPYAPQWFEKVVRAVVGKFAPSLGDRVTWSSMKADPLY
jgi:hypothetical protein